MPGGTVIGQALIDRVARTRHPIKLFVGDAPPVKISAVRALEIVRRVRCIGGGCTNRVRYIPKN